jgi:hypothetical protein
VPGDNINWLLKRAFKQQQQQQLYAHPSRENPQSLTLKTSVVGTQHKTFDSPVS